MHTLAPHPTASFTRPPGVKSAARLGRCGLLAALLATGTARAEITPNGSIYYEYGTEYLQTQSGQVNVGSYVARAAVTGFPGVTAVDVTTPAGTTGLVGSDGIFVSFSPEYTNQATYLAENPAGYAYPFALHQGASTYTTTLTAPNHATNYRPSAPVFTIAGVTGTWSTYVDLFGYTRGVFTFQYNPATTTTFTVTASAYAVPVSGGHRSTLVQAFTGAGLVGNIGLETLSDADAAIPTTLTFTTDATKANDIDTIDIAHGWFSLQAEYANLSHLITGTVLGTPDIVQYFATVSRTAFEIEAMAIPEPATYGLAALSALGLVAAIRRRRR